MSRADAHEPVGGGETRLGEHRGPVVMISMWVGDTGWGIR